MGGLTKAYHTWVCFLHKNGGHNKFIVEVSAEYLASAGATVTFVKKPDLKRLPETTWFTLTHFNRRRCSQSLNEYWFQNIDKDNYIRRDESCSTFKLWLCLALDLSVPLLHSGALGDWNATPGPSVTGHRSHSL
jgi:hypothetical protein